MKKILNFINVGGDKIRIEIDVKVHKKIIRYKSKTLENVTDRILGRMLLFPDVSQVKMKTQNSEEKMK